MLDDINSDLLSIYPGTFPNPRPFSKKPLVHNTGFQVNVRPPLQLYRVQCNNDYIAEKSKKAEAAIRKLYKAAVHTSSTASFKETSSIFVHESTSEATLSKYREHQIYTRSRMRKVNRKQLIKAIHLARRKEEDIKKQFDASISKVDLEETAIKTKSKPKSYGALRIDNRVFKIRKALASNSAPEAYSMVEHPYVATSPETVTKRLEGEGTQERLGEALSKPKCNQTVRRPATVKKVNESIKKRTEASEPGQNVVLPNKEYTFKEEEGETAGLMRKPLKQGNYTKIVTLKKKEWLKPGMNVEISTFPFANQNVGKRSGGTLQKLKKEENNNEIGHMYKINDVSHSVRVRKGYQSPSSTGFHKYSRTASPNGVKGTKEGTEKSDNSDNDVTKTYDIEKPPKTEQNEVESKQFESNLEQKRLNSGRKVLKNKYNVYKTEAVPHGLHLQEPAHVLRSEESSPRRQPKGSSVSNLPMVEETDVGKSESKYRLRKSVKRQERYLSLPQITPTLTIDDPRDDPKSRRINYRIGQLHCGGRKEVAFVNYNKA